MVRQSADGISLSSIAIRTPTDLKERLEQAAKQHGRSVGREAEARLIQSFSSNGVLNEANWSEATRNIARMVGLVLNQIDTLDGRPWCDTPEGIAAAQVGVAAVIDFPAAPGKQKAASGDPRRAETLKALAIALGRHLNGAADPTALQSAYNEAEDER